MRGDGRGGIPVSAAATEADSTRCAAGLRRRKSRQSHHVGAAAVKQHHRTEAQALE
jgi:hypothetical protein